MFYAFKKCKVTQHDVRRGVSNIYIAKIYFILYTMNIYRLLILLYIQHIVGRPVQYVRYTDRSKSLN